MRVVEVKVYEFKELSHENQDMAVELVGAMESEDDHDRIVEIIDKVGYEFLEDGNVFQEY